MTPWIWPDTFREKPLRDFVVDFSAPSSRPSSTIMHLWRENVTLLRRPIERDAQAHQPTQKCRSAKEC